jgi:hypothetical protein
VAVHTSLAQDQKGRLVSKIEELLAQSTTLSTDLFGEIVLDDNPGRIFAFKCVHVVLVALKTTIQSEEVVG